MRQQADVDGESAWHRAGTSTHLRQEPAERPSLPRTLPLDAERARSTGFLFLDADHRCCGAWPVSPMGDYGLMVLRGLRRR